MMLYYKLALTYGSLCTIETMLESEINHALFSRLQALMADDFRPTRIPPFVRFLGVLLVRFFFFFFTVDSLMRLRIL